MGRQRKINAFTLIELLVVISIIGILAAIGLVSFTGAQRQARDTQRKTDIKQYVVALETYGNSTDGIYPISTTSISLAGLCTSDLNLAGCSEDPTAGQTYLYQSNSSGTNYVVWAALEGTTNLWVACSNGLVGESIAPPVAGVCPLAPATPLPTPPPSPSNTPMQLPSPTDGPTPTSSPTPVPTLVPGGNLLVNPGFESGSSGWTGIGSGGASVVSTQFHSGSQSLEILQPASGTKTVTQIVNVAAGQIYLASGWVKTALSANSVQLSIIWRNSTGGTISTTTLGSQTGTQDWTQISLNVGAPLGSVTAVYQISVRSGSGAGWFDDLVLQ